MPEGKKNTAPVPAPVRDEDGYSAKTHLHQPVQETATVAATALLADAPEGALPSEVRPEIVTWEKLCEAIQASGKAYNMEMIQKAYELANNAHNGVCRRSGEPYICHPLAVARLVLDLGMDSESIAAALLHDVVEDTPTTLDDLKAAFGEEVALLVDGVTKLTKIQFSNIEELQAENLRKMLLAMSRDVRVMIIKLCDRLHNMRTGDAWPEQKRRDKARETMEVYAPIANRLGILNVKEELEDRSLHYLDPVGYSEISRMLSERSGEEFLIKVSGVIERRLVESGIEGATIKRRVKSIYGIYRKTIMQNKSFDEIYDIYAVRVILDSLAECYSTLGLIHDMYHPLPNRFKDYISTPKPNGYQSLHTTVIGHEGIPFEVQIRTRKMDEQAEYGVAAHWKYKEGREGHDKLDDRLAWVSQLLENQRLSEDSGNLLHDLKSDLLPEEVFAFTPKGDVINLPTGATCIDFAYAIHSAVGNRMVGCKVNNRMVPIDLQGPELRIGRLPQPLSLTAGQTVRLGAQGIPCPAALVHSVQPGQELLLDDGKLLARVDAVEPEALVCTVVRGGVLQSRKSLAAPGADIQMPTLTTEDKENLAIAAGCGVTGVMLPFVRGAADICNLRQALAEAGAPQLKILAKIENLAGVQALPEFLPLVDEVVIARGDLGNAMPLWELPRCQKQLSAACRAAGVPFMVVTQMLDSMHTRAVPTRAEVSDIYNAVLDGASSLMLTGETAAGQYPVQAMEYLVRTARTAM